MSDQRDSKQGSLRGRMICTKTGKITYESSKAAMQASIRFKRRKRAGFRKTDKATQPFYCDHCEGWHNGNRIGKDRPLGRKMSHRWR